MNEGGQSRVVIESIEPQVDCGRYPVKRVVGNTVTVTADIFADGHDEVAATLLFRQAGDSEWSEARLERMLNDRWTAEFPATAIGKYHFTISAWIDPFATWRRDFNKRLAARQATAVDAAVGADLIREAASLADGDARRQLEEFERLLRAFDAAAQHWMPDVETLSQLMYRWAPRKFATRPAAELPVWVDRPKAAFSAWYEMFPRSAAPEPRHGTLRDVITRLPYVASMGFDVLYLPPIHPIGISHRKGRNNAAVAEQGDAGSPWAIGAEEGGHKAIHPELGTMDDFRALVAAARDADIELALDIAFQTSPDHPYVRAHPEWFRKRPDGTIQYAENPPKKYQDIYPFDFGTEAWRDLWRELKSVFDFWIDEGVKIFRVDNPHTKPFPFWEWVIDEIHRAHPEVLFLAEAFTRPKVMYRLAKLGFSQSYTYFAWRDTKWEITEYFRELFTRPVSDFFRPNLWPNTPDILPEYLQLGGRPAFMVKIVLAATLSGNYGIYGPPFEHTWTMPREPGSEEYLNSEKYEIHQHDLDRPDSLSEFIARLNQIRRESPAIVDQRQPQFHAIENDQLIAYSRASHDQQDIVLVIVNLDPRHRQSGWIDFPVDAFDVPRSRPYQMHDLLTGARYLWHGNRNYVELDPDSTPAHIFRLRRKTRSERDFEYYL